MTAPLAQARTLGNAPVTQGRADRRYVRSSVQPLYNLTAKLANAKNERCDIPMFGDSIMEGAGADLVQNRWVDRAQALLRAQFGPPVQGPGFVPPFYGSGPAGGGSWTTGWTYSGSWTNIGYGWGFRGRQPTTTDGTASCTITRTCTSFVLHFRRLASSDAVTITVDGGTPTTFTMNNAVNQQKWTSPQYSAAPHTIVITQSVNQPVFAGSMFYNGDENAGVALWDASRSGARYNSFVSTDAAAYLGLMSPAPAGVVLGLGTNDCRRSSNGYSSIEFRNWAKRFVASIRTTVPNVPILFMPPYKPLGPLIEPWENYTAAMQSLCDEFGYASVFDMSLSIPYLQGDPYGSLIDSVHPSTRMHALLASLAAAAVNPR